MIDQWWKKSTVLVPDRAAQYKRSLECYYYKAILSIVTLLRHENIISRLMRRRPSVVSDSEPNFQSYKIELEFELTTLHSAFSEKEQTVTIVDGVERVIGTVSASKEARSAALPHCGRGDGAVVLLLPLPLPLPPAAAAAGPSSQRWWWRRGAGPTTSHWVMALTSLRR